MMNPRCLRPGCRHPANFHEHRHGQPLNGGACWNIGCECEGLVWSHDVAVRIAWAFKAGWRRYGRVLGLVFVLAGCGNVTAVDEPMRGPAEQDASDVGMAALADRGSVDASADGAANHDETPGTDGSPSDASCSAPAGCAACTQAGPTGPGYRTAAQCAEVIACVRAGDAGDYPWQTCHNMAGGGDAYGGLACAGQLVKACP